MSDWYAHGKLLLTGEYLVLEGASALALPLKLGQSFSALKTSDKQISWQANYLLEPWFSATLSLPELKIISSDNQKLAKQLQKIFFQLQQLKSDLFIKSQGFTIRTVLDFNPEFGLGSSSTLIANLARWAGVDPYELQKITFGGSGYDIACALSGKPLFYQLQNEKPIITEIEFSPKFSDKLYFVYLGKKQISLESISHFKKHGVFSKNDIRRISEIGKQIMLTDSFEEFESLLVQHENIMAKILGQQTVQSLLFRDFAGTVKSLGAWGGDFVLMTFSDGKAKLKQYLSSKNLDVVFTYDELILT